MPLMGLGLNLLNKPSLENTDLIRSNLIELALVLDRVSNKHFFRLENLKSRINALP